MEDLLFNGWPSQAPAGSLPEDVCQRINGDDIEYILDRQSCGSPPSPQQPHSLPHGSLAAYPKLQPARSGLVGLLASASSHDQLAHVPALPCMQETDVLPATCSSSSITILYTEQVHRAIGVDVARRWLSWILIHNVQEHSVR
jgi:hypothetical protein